MQNLRRAGENSDPTLADCGPKFTKFSNDVGSPLYFPIPLSDCMYYVSFRRYSPLSLEVGEKQSKCKSLWPPIFVGGMSVTFLRHSVRATYYSLLGKVWLSPFAYVRLRSLAMKPNAELTESG